MAIYGESENQLDEKGRISVPRKFQPLFAEGGFLTRDFEDQCLTFYPKASWGEIQAILNGLPFSEKGAKPVARRLSSGTEIQLDGQGRLSIPPTLRRHANLDKACTLLALGNKLEIWDTETYRAYDQNSLTSDIMEQALSAINARLSGM